MRKTVLVVISELILGPERKVVKLDLGIVAEHQMHKVFVLRDSLLHLCHGNGPVLFPSHQEPHGQDHMLRHLDYFEVRVLLHLLHSLEEHWLVLKVGP